MGLKKYKPTTPSLRSRQNLDYAELTETKPEKSLLIAISKKSGRNNQGKVTVRRRGGGNKRRFRLVDFQRKKDGVDGVVSSVEYDPNRTAFISLIKYKDGDKRYIVTTSKMKMGDIVQSGADADVKPGNTLPLKNIPAGSIIHNIELTVGAGAQLARSAGVGAILQAKTGDYAAIKLPSGEVRLVNLKCRATVGQVGNADNRNVVIGKAGKSRWLRKRPKVRGSAMNACDHPHGGGEGKAPIGQPGPRTPWGKPTLGYKTRKKSKRTNKFIVRRRK